jgi:hypothetical protein
MNSIYRSYLAPRHLLYDGIGGSARALKVYNPTYSVFVMGVTRRTPPIFYVLSCNSKVFSNFIL